MEDIREATGGETALLESRDQGFFVVDMPSFWERSEMNGMLRDVREKPDKYDWLGVSSTHALPRAEALEDEELLGVLRTLAKKLRTAIAGRAPVVPHAISGSPPRL